MDAREIKDSETLERWLQDRPCEDAMNISLRAALRVFPFWSEAMDEPWAIRNGLTAIPLLRSLLISAVSLRFPTTVGSALFDTIRVALRDAADTAVSSTSARATRAVRLAADTAANAERVRKTGAHAAIAVGQFRSTAAAVRSSAAYSADVVRATNAAGAWVGISGDALSLQSGTDPTATPLWPTQPPDWFTNADTRTRAIWSRDPGPWEFWLRWWDGMLAGRPLDWDLQRDVALIPDEDWRKGPTHIAGIIRDIELRHAIAATPNGEEVEVNPDTGLLRLVPVTELPDDIAEYARRKIRRAAGVFGIFPGNQYAALNDDLRMLSDAADDPEMTPVELFDACASASRRLVQRSARHECPQPEEDALIADYATRIREAGADILGNDLQTQAVLTARHAIIGTGSLVDDRETIMLATGLMVPATEGLLSRRLAADAETATNPNADSEDRKVATFRFFSRALRITGWATRRAGQGIMVVAGSAVLEAILVSPPFQDLLQVIYRFMGF